MIQKGNLFHVLDVMGCSLIVMTLGVVGGEKINGNESTQTKGIDIAVFIFPQTWQRRLCFQAWSLQWPGSQKENKSKGKQQKPKQATQGSKESFQKQL